MTGMERAIIRVRQPRIRQDQVRAITGWRGGARGNTSISTRALPIATGALRLMRTAATAFVVPAHILNSVKLAFAFLKS
jgi:hypothetical protein